MLPATRRSVCVRAVTSTDKDIDKEDSSYTCTYLYNLSHAIDITDVDKNEIIMIELFALNLLKHSIVLSYFKHQTWNHVQTKEDESRNTPPILKSANHINRKLGAFHRKLVEATHFCIVFFPTCITFRKKLSVQDTRKCMQWCISIFHTDLFVVNKILIIITQKSPFV